MTKRRRPSDPSTSTKRIVGLIIPLLSIVGLYWFAASFFLAKRSLAQTSTCDEAPSLLKSTLGLTDNELSIIASLKSSSKSKGCWLDRRVDSLVILVVDALRFDFAQHELPLSVGARLQRAKHLQQHSNNGTTTVSSATTSSQLLQFVADPPTVTMQRLKGLTTGGLPTFADISGNFGGAAIDEDSWIQQMKTTPFSKRGLQHPSRLGFVGDDTWVDLFPTQFQESYPLPSFNTRDLDTVDNGCLERLPLLLQDLRTTGETPQELEVIVAHFLGVDHVGHTFGPHNQHMHDKLAQMDAALSTTLDILDDDEESCHLALIFGDHGMTEDGNHGGGTDDEINAALFVHFSPACGYMPLDMTPQTGSTYIQEAFQSIHQIDLVPTISILLGLPIPYANIGGIAPSLLGLDGVQETAAALALNAAQVWRYFTVYSSTANKLPNLPELEERLQEAIHVYKQALAHPNAGDDSNLYYKACGLFKIFLLEASELGHRVWTRFDTVGMFLGGAIILVTLLLSLALLYMGAATLYLPQAQNLEVAISVVFIIFQSGMLSFSNSYIEAEQAICMFMLAVLGVLIYIRMSNHPGNPGNVRILPILALVVPVLSRIGETMVSGHGLDPSIRLHLAHNSAVFLSSLAVLITMRIQIYRKLATKVKTGLFHAVADCIAMLFLALGWIEKRNPDVTRNGYLWVRAVIAILILCTPITIYEALCPRPSVPQSEKHAAPPPQDALLARSLAAISKLLLALITVTGPSTAASVVLVSTQAWILYILGGASGPYQTSSAVQAILWRLVIRHVFFATNHACAFNRLQYSAAFVASMEFSFVLGGAQLFLNTFGWEILGLVLVVVTSSTLQKPYLWKWYCLYQLIESFCSCISVGLLRRHLMVWAVYAPRFLFACIFLILNVTAQLIVYFLP